MEVREDPEVWLRGLFAFLLCLFYGEEGSKLQKVFPFVIELA